MLQAGRHPAYSRTSTQSRAAATKSRGGVGGLADVACKEEVCSVKSCVRMLAARILGALVEDQDAIFPLVMDTLLGERVPGRGLTDSDDGARRAGYTTAIALHITAIAGYTTARRL